MSDPENRSATTLLSDAIAQMTTLMREEINLAKAEISESANRAAIAVGLLVGAVVISLTALDVLAAALVVALTDLGLAAGWAALIVGIALAVIAFVMAGKGVEDLKASNFAPRRTMKNVRRDADTIKEAANADR